MGRAARRDDGAAAVEFALLLPIFVVLVFGVISTGLALWRHISDVQAARDAARYGSTLPVTDVGTSTDCASDQLSQAGWLTCVQDVAIHQAGWANAAAVGTNNDHGYVCVAYVKDTTPTGANAKVLSARLTAGSANPDDPAPSDPNTCFADGRSDGRVQVYVRRNGEFNAILFARTWKMDTQISVPYERGAP